MEPIRGLPGIQGPTQVHERNAGGNKQQAEAFRRAMQEHAGKGGADREGSRAQSPMRRALQPRPQDGRKQEGEAMHVDVIA